MKAIVKDPLLTVARAIITIVIAFFGLAISAMAISLPIMLLNQDRVLASIAEESITVGPEFFGAASLIMLLLATMLALSIWFLVLLRRIVNTVGEGDPFVPDNADRLARMGWIAVGAQAIAIPVGALAMWLAEIFKDADNVHVGDDFGLSLGGIVLVVILFILARVFRQGTAMRDDLEGTV